MSTPETFPPILHAARYADWQQVVLNGGPPCFHLEETGRFCLRAQRWVGHANKTDYPYHQFVSLEDLCTRLAEVEKELAKAKQERDDFHQCLLNREQSLKRSGEDWVRAKEELDRAKEANSELVNALRRIEAEALIGNPTWIRSFASQTIDAAIAKSAKDKTFWQDAVNKAGGTQ